MLSDGRHSYIHKYGSNASMLSSVIFYLKSVHFLLFVQYIIFSVTKNRPKFETEKSENIIGLDSYILNSFSYLDPI